ncbi:MAG: hypothetical protein U0R77_04455 [Mycolicibacterium insubricum]
MKRRETRGEVSGPTAAGMRRRQGQLPGEMAPLVRLRAARLESPRNGTGGAGGYLQVGAYNWVASPTTPVVYDKNTVTAGNGGSGTGTGSTGGNGTTWTQSSGNATDGWATANPTTGDVTSTTVTLSNGVNAP